MPTAEHSFRHPYLGAHLGARASGPHVRCPEGTYRLTHQQPSPTRSPSPSSSYLQV